MYTAAEVESLKERLEAEGKSKPEIVVALAWACFGWPYVWGAWGAMCTPEERKTRAGYRPDKKENIYKTCPVLSGKQASCDGCPWQGTRCFDCRGLTDWLLKQVGLDLYGDTCGAQYEKESNWAVRGNYADMPTGLVGCVFERKNGKWQHTGMHVGMGVTVHCSGTVQDGERDWTAYGIPAGLYTDDDLRAAGIDPKNNLPTLRRGSKGEYVKQLQVLLLCEGYGDLLADDTQNPMDGIFGQRTEKAVKAFQKDHGLTVDGIVGKKTWAALEAANEPGAPEAPVEPEAPEEPDEDEEPETPEELEKDFVSVPRYWLECIAGHLEDLALDLRERIGGG